MATGGDKVIRPSHPYKQIRKRCRHAGWFFPACQQLRALQFFMSHRSQPWQGVSLPKISSSATSGKSRPATYEALATTSAVTVVLLGPKMSNLSKKIWMRCRLNFSGLQARELQFMSRVTALAGVSLPKIASHATGDKRRLQFMRRLQQLVSKRLSC